MIKAIEKGKDEKIQKVTISYRNYKYSVHLETRHCVRYTVMIHSVDETNITNELGEIATATYISYKMLSKFDFLAKSWGQCNNNL